MTPKKLDDAVFLNEKNKIRNQKNENERKTIRSKNQNREKRAGDNNEKSFILF